MIQTLMELALFGIGGVIFQVLIKVRALRRRTENMVINVSLTKYLIDEWDNIMLSASMVILVLFAARERLLQSTYDPLIIRGLFSTVGYAGASIACNFFSRTEKRVNREIDKISKEAEETNTTKTQ